MKSSDSGGEFRRPRIDPSRIIVDGTPEQNQDLWERYLATHPVTHREIQALFSEYSDPVDRTTEAGLPLKDSGVVVEPVIPPIDSFPTE